ncbi:hypothetical protein L0F63_000629 [Massospora cicadina]|nr:hypothetical protein L0F63_000629 [Massospora cicadina]
MGRLTYSPYSRHGCLDSAEIESELQAISKVTNRIRLYGCDCNQADKVLGLISKNGWGTRVLIGIWTRGGKERFHAELNQTLEVMRDTSKSQLIDGIVVGNEDLFNGVSESEVILNLIFVRNMLQKAGFGRFSVSTSEVFTLWTPSLAENSDVILSTIYPFYTQRTTNDTVAEVAVNSIYQLTRMLENLKSSKTLVVGETGYPKDGDAPVMFDNPTQTNQCIYLNSFRCHAAKLNLPYFFFEAKDGQWKGGYSTEKHFGLLNSDNSLRCPPTPCY